MEYSKKYRFVNLSNRIFEPTIYEDSSYSGILGMKPNHAFWGALESKEEGHYSLWDEMYGIDSARYATTFSYSEDTEVVSPSEIEKELIQFYQILQEEHSKLSDIEVRNMFLSYLKKRGIVDSTIQYLICQIDLSDDQDAIEEAFTGFRLGKQNADEVFYDFDYKIRKGIRSCFSGIEVTGFALGESEIAVGGIYELEYYKMQREPRYKIENDNTHLGLWDIHSVAIFDTNAIQILEQKIIDPEMSKESKMG